MNNNLFDQYSTQHAHEFIHYAIAFFMPFFYLVSFHPTHAYIVGKKKKHLKESYPRILWELKILIETNQT